MISVENSTAILLQLNKMIDRYLQNISIKLNNSCAYCITFAKAVSHVCHQNNPKSYVKIYKKHPPKKC